MCIIHLLHLWATIHHGIPPHRIVELIIHWGGQPPHRIP